MIFLKMNVLVGFAFSAFCQTFVQAHNTDAPTDKSTEWWCRDIADFVAVQKNGQKIDCNILRNKTSVKKRRQICEEQNSFDGEKFATKFWCSKTCEYLCSGVSPTKSPRKSPTRSPNTKIYNCKTKEVWSQDKKAWCCKNKIDSCYNCKTKEIWTQDKKAWCCRNENEGCSPVCPTTCSSWFDGCNTCGCKKMGTVGICTQEFCKVYKDPRCSKYNCDTREAWTQDKKAWCCKNENEGCSPRKSPTRSPRKSPTRSPTITPTLPNRTVVEFFKLDSNIVSLPLGKIVLSDKKGNLKRLSIRNQITFFSFQQDRSLEFVIYDGTCAKLGGQNFRDNLPNLRFTKDGPISAERIAQGLTVEDLRGKPLVIIMGNKERYGCGSFA